MAETGEWITAGNPSPNGKKLTPRQQGFWDGIVNSRHLTEFLPEGCRSCIPAQAFCIDGLARQLAEGTLGVDRAIKQVINYSRGCEGPQYEQGVADASPICPPNEAKESAGWAR
jgi:hypothetical protein